MFMTYNGLGPRYLKDLITLHIFALPLRSSDEGLLLVPPLAEARSRGIRGKALWHLTPALEFLL